MSAYIEGYQAGYKEEDGENLADVLTLLESIGQGSAEQESDYWLGYYHGKYHARTGQPPIGAVKRSELN